MNFIFNKVYSCKTIVNFSTVLYRNGVVPELHREKGLPRCGKGVARLIVADWAAR